MNSATAPSWLTLAFILDAWPFTFAAVAMFFVKSGSFVGINVSFGGVAVFSAGGVVFSAGGVAVDCPTGGNTPFGVGVTFGVSVAADVLLFSGCYEVPAEPAAEVTVIWHFSV